MATANKKREAVRRGAGDGGVLLTDEDGTGSICYRRLQGQDQLGQALRVRWVKIAHGGFLPL